MSGVVTGEAAVLLFCQRRTAPYAGVDVQDFSSSWTSGLAIAALAHSLDPTAIDYYKIDRSDPVVLWKAALEAFEKMGIGKLVTAEDIVKCPDSKCILLQLSEVLTGYQAGVKVTDPKRKTQAYDEMDREEAELRRKEREEREYLMAHPPECPGCHDGVMPGQQSIKACGQTYHVLCLSCMKCKKRIGISKFLDVGGEPFCDMCGKLAKKKWDSEHPGEAVPLPVPKATTVETPEPVKPKFVEDDGTNALGLRRSQPSQTTTKEAPPLSRKEAEVLAALNARRSRLEQGGEAIEIKKSTPAAVPASAPLQSRRLSPQEEVLARLQKRRERVEETTIAEETASATAFQKVVVEAAAVAKKPTTTPPSAKTATPAPPPAAAATPDPDAAALLEKMKQRLAELKKKKQEEEERDRLLKEKLARIAELKAKLAAQQAAEENPPPEEDEDEILRRKQEELRLKRERLEKLRASMRNSEEPAPQPTTQEPSETADTQAEDSNTLKEPEASIPEKPAEEQPSEVTSSKDHDSFSPKEEFKASVDDVIAQRRQQREEKMRALLADSETLATPPSSTSATAAAPATPSVDATTSAISNLDLTAEEEEMQRKRAERAARLKAILSQS
ncbi:hypothetical protein Pelo_16306 [Pelomyxa schiedti]|nr:hypothetical protein Pelo_16306 [Pelomyxa schiedti]